MSDARGVDLHSTRDARVWAQEFLRLNPDCGLTVDVMLAWFANAIMVGWDHGRARLEQENKDRKLAMVQKVLHFDLGLDIPTHCGSTVELPQPAELPDHECG